MAGTVALDVLVLAAILLLGALVALTIGKRLPPADLVALAFPLGAGTLTWLLFVASWLGIPITLLTVGTVYLVVLLVVGVRFLRQRKGAPRQAEVGPEGDPLERRVSGSVALWAAFAILVLASVILAVGRSYSAWDDIAIWSVKAYGIAREGTIFAGARWGAHGLSYPLNLPLLISVFRLVDGDVLPGSKLIFPMMYLSLALGCYGFWRHLGVRPWAAGSGMLLIATTPVIFEHGTIGYANLPFACYLVLSVLWYVRANKEGRPGSYVLSGILLGLASWTRPEGLVIGVVVALALLTARRLSPEGQVRYAAWLLPAALIGGAWQLFAALYAGGGEISQAIVSASQAIAQGDLHASAFYWIARFLVHQALSPSAWGVLLPLGVVVVVMRSPELWRRWDPALLATFAAAAALGIGMVGFYYLVSFVGDLVFWLGTGVDRMFLPG